MNYKQLTAIAAASLLASIANAEWNYGIGSGIAASSYDGSLKNSDFGIDGDVEYDQDDFESGIGAAAFATDGTWVFNLRGSAVEYESKDTAGGAPFRTTNNFERTFAEFTVGYVAYQEDAITLTPYIGINYTKHEWEFKGGGLKINLEDNWTDAVFGLKFDYKINDEWTWNNSANYSAGDSEGCFGVKTGASWKFAEHWVAGAYVGYESDEFDGSDSVIGTQVDFDY
ncbi:MAG: hypothetical protein ABS34_11645, partial [Opitutaceae bacterium BACL24 MAG-120322-bin51]